MTAVLLAAVTALTEGAFGVYSPDGMRLAYQAETNGLVQVAVRNLKTGAVTWISEGPGEGMYPAWGRDGAVIYTYGHESGTAFARKKESRAGGYNLFRWKNGRSHRLTGGRTRDTLASVAPDGSVWFTTTRGLETAHPGLMIRDKIVRRRKGGALEDVRVRPLANSGAHSASVSPDGKRLLWTQLELLRGIWRIAAAPLDRADTAQPCFLTPVDMCAYSPRWSPDGRFVAYTACGPGDPGWCVYVQELASARTVRIAEGRHPSFSPDGRKLAYDRDGRIFEQDFVWDPKAGRILADDPAVRTDDGDLRWYRVAFSVREGTGYGDRRHDVTANVLPIFSVRGSGEEKGNPLVFHLRNGRPMFRSDDLAGAGANTFVSEPCAYGTNVVFTCLRSDHALSVYRDGKLAATRRYPAGLVSLRGSALPAVEKCPAIEIASFSFGEGMPEGIERPVSRQELFGGVK